MNTRLTYQILGLALLVPAAALGQSNASTGSLPSYNWNRFVKNMNFSAFYTHDFVSNTGGAKAGPRNIGAIDVYLNPDLSKFTRVNGEIMIHYNHINKADERGAVGDAQVASNIDVPGQVDRLTDLYYQHNISDNFKALAGFHDISAEFNVTESSLNFLNSSFGTSAELSYSGPHGVPVYPLTTVGGRAEYVVNDEFVIRTGVYDADPGDSTKMRSMTSGIGTSEGIFHISEVAHTLDNQKIAIGGWNYSEAQTKLKNEDEKDTAFGAFGVYEREAAKNLWGFFRLGWANPTVNMVQSNVATGVIYRGIFQNKKNQDEVGLGLTRVHLTENSEDETTIEGYYHFKPFKQLTLRPDLQYVTNPSGDAELEDAWVVGLRTVVEI